MSKIKLHFTLVSMAIMAVIHHFSFLFFFFVRFQNTNAEWLNISAPT